MLLCLCTAPSSAQAQLDIPDVQGPSGASQVEAGVELLREGRPADAAALLRSALDADSALVSPAHGAAA
ncbi:hypothetical protein, partial [Salinibacter ruber]